MFRSNLYIKFEDDNFLRENGGFIVGLEDYKALINSTKDFHETVTAEQIDEYNEQIRQAQHEEYERSRNTPKPKKIVNGYLYFVQADNAHFKIGVTTNLKSRMKSLQVASPNNLVLKAYIEFNNYEKDEVYEAEREAHIYFDDDWLTGEWFDISLKDIQKFAKAFSYELKVI